MGVLAFLRALTSPGTSTLPPHRIRFPLSGNSTITPAASHNDDTVLAASNASTFPGEESPARYQPPLELGPYQQKIRNLRPECFRRPKPQVRWTMDTPTTTVAFVLDQLVQYVTSPPIPPPLDDDYRQIFTRDWAVFLTHLRGIYSGALLHSLNVRRDDDSTKTMVVRDFLETWNESFFMPRGAEFSLGRTNDACTEIPIASSTIHLTWFAPLVDQEQQAAILTGDSAKDMSVEADIVGQPSEGDDPQSDSEKPLSVASSVIEMDMASTGITYTVYGPYEHTVVHCFDKLPTPHTSFFRPPDLGNPWPVPPSKVLDLLPSWEMGERPPMPSILKRFDVGRKDWDLVADHVSQALDGTIPIINLEDAPRNSALQELIVADIIQCWNTYFFHKRSLELVVKDEEDNSPWAIDSSLDGQTLPSYLILQIRQPDSASVLSFGDSDSEMSFGPATRRELPGGEYAPFSIVPNIQNTETDEYYSADDEAQCCNDIPEDRSSRRSSLAQDGWEISASSDASCRTPGPDGLGVENTQIHGMPAISLRSSASSLGKPKPRRRRSTAYPPQRVSQTQTSITMSIPPITTASLKYRRNVDNTSPSAASTAFSSPSSPSNPHWRRNRDSGDSRTAVSSPGLGTPIDPPPLPKPWEWNV